MLAKLILLAFLSMMFPVMTYANSFSYDLPLDYLCEKSELIVVGRSERVETINKKEKKLLLGNLDIISILKGNNETLLKYQFSHEVNFVKPNKEGDIILVFLVEVMPCIHGRPYKTVVGKMLSITEINLYIEKINLLLEVLKEKNIFSKNQQIVEWLVKCAEKPITCYEGVYGLSRNSAFIELLTEEQKTRLVNVLLSCRKKDEIECLVNVIKHYDEAFVLSYVIDVFSNCTKLGTDEFSLIYSLRDVKGNKVLLPFAIEYLESNINNLHSDITFVCMAVVVSLKESKQGEILLDQFFKLGFDRKTEAKQKDVFNDFILLMKE